MRALYGSYGGNLYQVRRASDTTTRDIGLPAEGCFDYGNSETTRAADAAGAMDAINFSRQCWFGGCAGSGPWVRADLEWGLYPGGSQSWNSNQRAFASPYVTAMLKNNGTSRFALKGGNAQSGSLTTLWDGALPNGYSPMRKQGAIILAAAATAAGPAVVAAA